MKLNAHTALSTPTLLLVPYSEHHVPHYHEWMKDPDLQSATASEPLSLEEEYAMQRSWRGDRDKLTFIICQPLRQKDDREQRPGMSHVRVGEDDSPERMIGDINLFLFDAEIEEGEREVEELGGSGSGSVVGEVELMIARKSLQRQGFGRAALLTFIDYIHTHWPDIAAEYAQSGAITPQLSFLRVKINQTNVGSIRLFEGVGFIRTTEEPNYFGELELRFVPDLEGLRKQKGWEEVVELGYG
ncbi:N-acetyltransferase 9-like protein [Fulvia fulva]|uniref:N-acetyltransferase 9-like protein n=1 Tax=Passalora fulva TaxID=5499 RepID=A0A9Q8P7I1_PASFU|nr:N-acetyltransferase 9-like protein [Fulvia fulva]KAK4615824.1 N-acetyltransferase 9-like protein [Fulvia fulva]KAK4616464.1 N-acetyltransferase 9-like protein [Fulvia fulva]UJO16170.1 N-acetyltransferase 9-like protein [Fulvia fulva]WPV18736.1 N-acetyltransferase 9-like protein [Fulvia fulva]WPV34433.1 N-acetyltransferase 9-like protein [Fulvia fulva]